MANPFEGPSLDELIQKEAEEFENLSAAFIKYSLAHVNLTTRLREIRENQPNLFTGEWDFNEVAFLRPT